MAITKEDIQNEGFEHSMRGYNVEQVDVFLERVAKEVDVMNTRIGELEIQLASTKDELSNAQEQLSARENLSPEELEQSKAREKQTREELEQAQAKLADAVVRAETAENLMRDAEIRAKAAEEQIAPLQEQLAEKNKLDSAIAEAFISAQRSAEQIKEEARAEGDRIYRESEAKAREFIRESLAKKAAVNNEIESLQTSMTKFKTEYLGMLARFTSQAKGEFKSMENVLVSDEDINAVLPNIEDMPGLSAQEEATEPEQTKISDDDLPKLKTQQLPQINIPSVYPEN